MPPVAVPLDPAVERLIEVVQEVSLAHSLDALMQVVRTEARKLTGADGATFVLRDGDRCFYADEDAIAPLWKGLRFPMETCISGWVMIHGQPAVIPDIYADPRIPAEAYRPTFVKSLAMVPIRTKSPVGAIGNYWATPRQPTDREVRLLQALADSTAVAMENVQLYEGLEQRVAERTRDLEARNAELTAALDQVHRLEKIVQMCAWTKRFEVDGEWVDVEEFLARRYGVTVSHGISEELAAELEPPDPLPPSG